MSNWYNIRSFGGFFYGQTNIFLVKEAVSKPGCYFCSMKKCLTIFSILLILLLAQTTINAQCAMCTKTAQQLGEKPAQGLNSGILYLMIAPFAIVGFIGYRWWKSDRS